MKLPNLAKCQQPGIMTPETWMRWGWIVESVAKRYGLKVTHLLARDRGQRIERARRDLYVCLWASGLGYSEIGRMLGRDHSTVLEGVRKELAA